MINISKSRKWLGRVFLLLVLLLLYAPIIWLIVFSFTDSITYNAWKGFNTIAYHKLFNGPKSSTIADALINTLAISSASTIISAILGTIGALAIYSIKNKYVNRFLRTTSNIPLLNADIVTAVSSMLFFAIMKEVLHATGYITSYIKLILIHASFCTPYVLLNVLPRLSRLDKNIYEAAIDLGARSTQAINKVIIPQLIPGIIMGSVLAFTISIDDFIITQYNIQGFHTLSTYIYSMHGGKDTLPIEIRALSTLIFFVLITLLIVVALAQKDVKLFIKVDKATKKPIKPVKQKTIFPKYKRNKFAAASLLLFFSSFAIIPPLRTKTQNVLVIGNWAEYIADGVIDDFKKYYKEITGKNITIKYDDTFTTTEDMFNKVSGRQHYDILCPSEYTVEKLIKRNMLVELKKELGKDKNGNVIEDYRKNITPLFANKADFDDELKYCIPYMWSTIGISYNQEEVEKYGDLKDVDSWDILWNENYKGRIKMKNSVRDMYIITMIKNNKEALLNGTKDIKNVINDYSPESLKAFEKLIKEQRNIRAGWEDNEGKMDIIEGTICALPQWSGDAMWSAEHNAAINPNKANNVSYSIPKEGTNIFFDLFVIPNTARNTEAANLFINFICKPEIAIRNTDYIGYATCVADQKVMDYLNETYKDDFSDTTDLSYLFNLPNADKVHVNPNQFPHKSIIDKSAIMKDIPEEIEQKVLEIWLNKNKE